MSEHPGLGGHSETEIMLAGLRAELAAKRRAVYTTVEIDEIAACKRLAFDCFGYSGCVEFPSDPASNARCGPIQISILVQQRKPRPPITKPMFQGNSHAELLAQADLWRARGRK